MTDYKDLPKKREIEKMLDNMARELKEDSRRKFKDLEEKFVYRWNVDEMQQMFRNLDRKMESLEQKFEDLSRALEKLQDQ